jgi:hypothetical protein
VLTCETPSSANLPHKGEPGSLPSHRRASLPVKSPLRSPLSRQGCGLPKHQDATSTWNHAV